MLVIADSSPLHYLILIEEVDVLPSLFGQIIIPSAVVQELSHSHTLSSVRDFINVPPDWLVTQKPAHLAEIADIDKGELEAISLALELKADILLIDDLDGRRAA